MSWTTALNIKQRPWGICGVMWKILIIEDAPDIAAIERDYLELNGCRVEIAADGKAGLAIGLGGGFDLILLDMMLSGMDGFTVCRKLREKIEPVPARPRYIQTDWGAGYRFRG